MLATSVGEGLWMACHQRSEATLSDGSVTIEDLRVSHLEINQPIPLERFTLSHEAPDITFLSREEMIKRLEASDPK